MTTEADVARRDTIRKRLQMLAERKVKLQENLSLPLDVPKNPLEIRIRCVQWYASKEPQHTGIREAVDQFIRNVQNGLVKAGVAGQRYDWAVQDVVVFGVSTFRRVMNDMIVRGAVPTFFHNFVRVAGGVYGAPYLMGCLEELATLDAATEQMSTAEPAKQQWFLDQTDKFRRDAVKKLSRPIGGMALTEYDTVVQEYVDLIKDGATRLLKFRQDMQWRIQRDREIARSKRRPPTRHSPAAKPAEATVEPQAPPQSEILLPVPSAEETGPAQ